MADKYNLKNPAVKRILQEVKEMQSNPSDDFMSLPLEENIFEWQFAIRGPRETEFEGGIYHGRIQLPAENQDLLDKIKSSSRALATILERKDCFSFIDCVRAYQSKWRIGLSLDYKKEERRALAIKSRKAPPRFGTPERQKLIDEIHEYMMNRAPPVPQHRQSQDPEEHHPEHGEDETRVLSPNPETPASEELQSQTEVGRIVEEETENTNPNPAGVEASREIPFSVSNNQLAQDSERRFSSPRPETRVQKADDRLFTLAAIVLTIALVVLLPKKFIKSVEHGAVFMDGS